MPDRRPYGAYYPNSLDDDLEAIRAQDRRQREAAVTKKGKVRPAPKYIPKWEDVDVQLDDYSRWKYGNPRVNPPIPGPTPAQQAINAQGPLPGPDLATTLRAMRRPGDQPPPAAVSGLLPSPVAAPRYLSDPRAASYLSPSTLYQQFARFFRRQAPDAGQGPAVQAAVIGRD